ncbi:MAG: M28 family peptidase [Candidatus Thorarchaeota archaeon]|nr:M28 family peptidase [Candidatus Thorarchaeota archaeon]
MALIVITLILFTPISLVSAQTTYSPLFNGENAYDYLVAQCDFGPRPPGSNNLSECREYIADTLTALGWSVSLQNFTYREVECSNIIASWPVQNASIIILGAHYDTRPHADQESDPDNRTLPILGANDGGSGVAALLELASVLPEASRSSVEMVFFDAEDSGYIDGWDWIVGSTYYVDQMSSAKIASVSAMILLDMIGDTNLRIPREASSTDSLQDTIYSLAAELGHDDIFPDISGSSILDDHRPFLSAGISSVDLIHTPFPWTWHTLHDTPEHCSPVSLEAVGQVVETFIIEMTTTNSTFTTDPSGDYTLLIIAVLIIAPIVIICFYKRK